MSRIAARFEALKREGRGGLVTYLQAYDPDPACSMAILRGLHEDAIAVVEALYEAGVRVAEVPLNSPDPFTTIALLVRHFEGRMHIGAGTVLDVDGGGAFTG